MKTLHNSTVDGANKNVSDLVIYGDGDTFKLICKASSEEEGWMKSTKAMEIYGIGCVVQVTTQQRNRIKLEKIHDSIRDEDTWVFSDTYVIAEALTFVPNVEIELIDGDKVNGRRLVPIKR